jgi:hypothetical protein
LPGNFPLSNGITLFLITEQGMTTSGIFFELSLINMARLQFSS